MGLQKALWLQQQYKKLQNKTGTYAQTENLLVSKFCFTFS